MNTPYNNLTTIKSLKNTVLYDDQVFSWSTHLIGHGPVRSRILADSVLSKILGRVRQVRIWRTVLAAALLFPAAAFCIYQDPLLLIPGLPIICLRAIAIRRERASLGDLLVLIVQADFPKEKLSQTTLYQIGEYYSRKYALPSLVDTLVHWGNLSHYAITFGFILPALLLYLNFWLSIFLLACAVLVPRIFAGTKLYYKLIK